MNGRKSNVCVADGAASDDAILNLFAELPDDIGGGILDEDDRGEYRSLLDNALQDLARRILATPNRAQAGAKETRASSRNGTSGGSKETNVDPAAVV